MVTATVDTDIQKGGAYVVDACGNTHHFVGFGTFEQLHAGWLSSHSAGYRCNCYYCWVCSGAKSMIVLMVSKVS